MEHLTYMKAIKNALKSKRVIYEELAKHLSMSESGVKKMLNANDISFRRIVQISEFLGTSPGQLLAAAEESEIPIHYLTKKQEDSLLADRCLLAVFWRLVIEKVEISKIPSLQGITLKELNAKLHKLVRLELIKKVGDHYFSTRPGKFKWPKKSKLAKTLNKEWSKLILRRSLEPIEEDKCLHRLITTKISDKSYKLMLARINDLFDSIVKISEKEELMHKGQLKNLSLMIATNQQGVLD